MNLPFRRKPVKVTKSQQKRLVSRANRRTKFLPKLWRAKAFHFEVNKLTKRKKARLVLTQIGVVGFSKRRKVLKLVNAFVIQTRIIEDQYVGNVLERELYKQRAIFDEGISNLLGKKTDKFLDLFFNAKI